MFSLFVLHIGRHANFSRRWTLPRILDTTGSVGASQRTGRHAAGPHTGYALRVNVPTRSYQCTSDDHSWCGSWTAAAGGNDTDAWEMERTRSSRCLDQWAVYTFNMLTVDTHSHGRTVVPKTIYANSVRLVAHRADTLQRQHKESEYKESEWSSIVRVAVLSRYVGLRHWTEVDWPPWLVSWCYDCCHTAH